MKSLPFLIILLFSLNCRAQNYGLDTTFGDAGTKSGLVTNFYPENGLLINNNYYFVNSTHQIAKIDYNGNPVINFGTNGVLSLTNPNRTYKILNFKFIDGYFYMYGESTNTTNNNKDIFICKIDERGNADTTFGNNGIVTIDFGNNEIISDFIMEPNGNLLCLGTQYFSDYNIPSKLIYFKLFSNGNINTAFESNGYKSYTVDLSSSGIVAVQRTEGKFIHPLNGKYLLSGTYKTQTPGSPGLGVRKEELLLTKIDNDGIIDTTFGNGGYQLVYLEGGMSNYVNDVQVINNNLYAKFFYAWSASTSGTKVLRYDLTTNQTIFNRPTLYSSYLKAESDGFYISGHERCSFPPSCQRKYNLKKYLSNGDLDPNFSDNGNYLFRFPNNSFHEDISSMHIKEANGKILIAGYSKDLFSLVRIKEQALGNPEFDSNTVSIYPNPFTDNFNINCDVAIKTVELFDLVGRKIEDLEFKAIDSNSYVVVPKISKTGIFVIKITSTDNKVLFKKIIKS